MRCSRREIGREIANWQMRIDVKAPSQRMCSGQEEAEEEQQQQE